MSINYPPTEPLIQHVPADAVTEPATGAVLALTGPLIHPNTLHRWAIDDAPPAVAVTDCRGRRWVLDHCHNRIFLSAQLRVCELSDALDEALDALVLADLDESFAGGEHW